MGGKRRDDDLVIGLRFSRDVVRRADALIPKLERTEFAAVRRSRALVLRLAVLRGLAQLESELAAKPSR